MATPSSLIRYFGHSQAENSSLADTPGHIPITPATLVTGVPYPLLRPLPSGKFIIGRHPGTHPNHTRNIGDRWVSPGRRYRRSSVGHIGCSWPVMNRRPGAAARRAGQPGPTISSEFGRSHRLQLAGDEPQARRSRSTCSRGRGPTVPSRRRIWPRRGSSFSGMVLVVVVLGFAWPRADGAFAAADLAAARVFLFGDGAGRSGPGVRIEGATDPILKRCPTGYARFGRWPGRPAAIRRLAHRGRD